MAVLSMQTSKTTIIRRKTKLTTTPFGTSKANNKDCVLVSYSTEDGKMWPRILLQAIREEKRHRRSSKTSTQSHRSSSCSSLLEKHHGTTTTNSSNQEPKESTPNLDYIFSASTTKESGLSIVCPTSPLSTNTTSTCISPRSLSFVESSIQPVGCRSTTLTGVPVVGKKFSSGLVPDKYSTKKLHHLKRLRRRAHTL